MCNELGCLDIVQATYKYEHYFIKNWLLNSAYLCTSYIQKSVHLRLSIILGLYMRGL